MASTSQPIRGIHDAAGHVGVNQYIWNGTAWVEDTGSGGGGGGGAVTIADGADVTEGSKSDPIWDGVSPASVISLLKKQVDELGTIAGDISAGEVNTADSGIVLLTTSFAFVIPFGTDSRLKRLFVTNLTSSIAHFSMKDGFSNIYFSSYPIAPKGVLSLNFNNANIRFGCQMKADESNALNIQYIGNIP